MAARVQGIPKTKRAIARLATDMRKAGREAQAEGAAEVAKEWRENVPVLSGEYQRSINSDEDSAFARADHAPFVEFGTAVREAQPVGTDAAARTQRRYVAIVRNKLRRAAR